MTIRHIDCPGLMTQRRLKWFLWRTKITHNNVSGRQIVNSDLCGRPIWRNMHDDRIISVCDCRFPCGIYFRLWLYIIVYWTLKIPCFYLYFDNDGQHIDGQQIEKRFFWMAQTVVLWDIPILSMETYPFCEPLGTTVVPEPQGFSEVTGTWGSGTTVFPDWG